MQVSNQTTANALLARPEKMDPQQQRLHKLFARKQAQIGNATQTPGSIAANDAKSRLMAALDPTLGTTAPGAVRKSGGPIGIGAGARAGAGAGTSIGVTPPGTSGTGPDKGITPLPTELAAELTVEGLMARWGSADAAYDLDASGSVDMKDLVMLLAGQGQAGGGPSVTEKKSGGPVEPTEILNTLGTTAPPAGEAPAEPTSPEVTMDGLMKAWGTDDPAFDLDGDGTVGMNDMLALLAQAGIAPAPGNGTPASATPGNAATPADPVEPGGPGQPGEPLTVDGFAKAWGTDDPMYDLDGDGTVGMNDLLAHLATVSPSVAGDQAKSADEATQPTFGSTDPGAMDKGEAAGFSNVAAAAGTAAAPGIGTGADAGAVKSPADDAIAAKPVTFDPAGSLAATLDGIESAKDAAATPGIGATAPADPAADPLVPRRLDPALLGGPSSYWTMAEGGTLDMATLAGLGDSSVQAATIESPEQAADILAQQLHDRLESFGFSDAPPANLHDILDGFRLADGDRKMVLERMQGMYPNGLGLNLVG